MGCGSSVEVIKSNEEEYDKLKEQSKNGNSDADYRLGLYFKDGYFGQQDYK